MERTPLDAAKETVKRLGGKWHGGYGKARCPAHDDRSPSLSVTPGDKAVLFKCFAGCSQEQIIDALKRGNYSVQIDRPGEPTDGRKDLSRLCRDLWAKALPLAGTPAQKYLDLRRIGHSTIGKFEPAALTYENDKRIRLPALYLPVHDNGRIVALDRVFLDPDGQKARALDEPKRTLADPRGGAVKIGKIRNDHLNLAEGFEDAESVIAMFNLPGCWSVGGVEFYARLKIPDHVRSITIYTQHGQGAAQGIEKGRVNLIGSQIRLLDIVPPPPGGDWNDAWRKAG